jgi:hypothetical protein
MADEAVSRLHLACKWLHAENVSSDQWHRVASSSDNHGLLLYLRNTSRIFTNAAIPAKLLMHFSLKNPKCDMKPNVDSDTARRELPYLHMHGSPLLDLLPTHQFIL